MNVIILLLHNILFSEVDVIMLHLLMYIFLVSSMLVLIID